MTGWRARPLATRLFVAVVATVAWAVIVAIASEHERVPFFWVFGAEIIRDACWLTLLTTMARGLAPRTLITSVHALWIGVLCAGVFFRLVGRAYFGGDLSKWPERSSLKGLVASKLPLLVARGQIDPPMFAVQGDVLNAAMCAGASGCPTYLMLQGQSHMSEIYAINTEETRLTDAIKAFIKKVK